MQTHSSFPIQELEQIECAILANRQLLAMLESRHSTLTEALDQITRPQPSVSLESLKNIDYGFEYRGALFCHGTWISIHTELLRTLWTDFPERREGIARAIKLQGSTRSYVAKTLAELFPNKSADWSERHSRTLLDGWLLDTNLSSAQIRSILRVAVQFVGLRWGEEVKLYWRSTQIS